MTTTTAASLTKHAEHVMGTVFSIHVADDGDWKDALAEVIADLHWVDETFSTYRPDKPDQPAQPRGHTAAGLRPRTG